jgi:hypothetical protein
VPPGALRIILTYEFGVPTGATGVVRRTEVSLITFKFVAELPPKVTKVVPVNPAPVRVTTVPPVSGPYAGETLVIVGKFNADTPHTQNPIKIKHNTVFTELFIKLYVILTPQLFPWLLCRVRI